MFLQKKLFNKKKELIERLIKFDITMQTESTVC